MLFSILATNDTNIATTILCVGENGQVSAVFTETKDGITGVLEYPGEQDITSPQQLDNHEECAGCAGYQTVHEAARESHGANCEAGQESEQDLDINPVCFSMVHDRFELSCTLRSRYSVVNDSTVHCMRPLQLFQ